MEDRGMTDTDTTIVILTPRYNPSLATILARRLDGVPGVCVMEDRRIKERRVRFTMMERTRRRREQRGSIWSLRGALVT